MKVELGEHDPHNYFDVIIGDGIKKSTAAMTKLPQKEFPYDHIRNKTFQINESTYHDYIESKWQARDSNIVYCNLQVDQNIFYVPNLIRLLVEEYPEYFKLSEKPWGYAFDNELTRERIKLGFDWELKNTDVYTDSFDAVAMQVPEDIVIHKYDKEQNKDYVATVHLSHANGWTADWAIGKDFRYIHADVPNIEKIIPKPERLVQNIIKSKKKVERVGAISFRTDTQLNRHPDSSPPTEFNKDDPKLFIRVERQVVIPYPLHNTFLFTIKTYFIDCNNKDEEKKDRIIKAFKGDTSKVYSNWFFEKYKKEVLEWLEK